MKIPSIALLMFAGSSWSSCPIVQSPRASSTLGQEQKAPKQSSVLAARLQLEDGTVAGKAWVLLESKDNLMGFPVHSQASRTDPESGLVRFENVLPGKYTLVGRWQADHEEPSSESLMRPSAAALPPSTPVWWGFRDEIVPTDSEYRLTLVGGIKQRFLVRTATDDRVDEVFVRLALKREKGYSSPLKMADGMLTIVRYVQASDDGFELNGLAPGAWTFVLTIPGYGRTGEVSLTVPHDDVNRVTVPKFITVSGKVRTTEGMQVSDVWVGIRYDPTYLHIVEDTQTATSSDRNGRFTIKNVRPGHVKLRASAERGRYLFETDLVLESGKNLADVWIDLVRAK